MMAEPSDEKIYVDYKDEERTIPCAAKFKTDINKIPK